MIHDSAIKKLFSEYEKVDKKKYTDFFLSTFSTNTFNSSLYALAVMKTFPMHSFMNPDKYSGIALDCRKYWNEESLKHHQECLPCPICSSMYKGENYDNMDWYFVYGLPVNDVYSLLYVITETNNMKHEHLPCENDFATFRTIVEILRDTPQDMKIRDVHKAMKKQDFFKEWVNKEKLFRKSSTFKDTDLPTPIAAMEEKLQFVLQTLGVCGILHTTKYLGVFYQYINPASVPQSSHNSDWEYPVDFWRGENGIDWNAFNYWFGGYKELESLGSK